MPSRDTSKSKGRTSWLATTLKPNDSPLWVRKLSGDALSVLVARSSREVPVIVGAGVEVELPDEAPEESPLGPRLEADPDEARLDPLPHHVAQAGIEGLAVIGVGRLDVPEVVRIVGPEAEAVVAARPRVSFQL